MATRSHYNNYLVLTQAQQRLDAMKVEADVSTKDLSADYWAGRLESELDEGIMPNIWRFGHLQVYPNLDNDLDWSLGTEEREAQKMQLREDFAMEFLRRYPGTYLGRNEGQAYLAWESHFGLWVNINLGQAMCERVLVREDLVEVPDPELLEEATRSVPLVKKVKPVYEWRCNDAELGLI